MIIKLVGVTYTICYIWQTLLILIINYICLDSNSSHGNQREAYSTTPDQSSSKQQDAQHDGKQYII